MEQAHAAVPSRLQDGGAGPVRLGGWLQIALVRGYADQLRAACGDARGRRVFTDVGNSGCKMTASSPF